MRRLPSLLALLAVSAALGACSVKTVTSGSPGDSPDAVVNAAGIGESCTAACGSADDRKCSMPSSDCPSNLCLVDPTQPVEHLAYCTVDCTNSACPTAYHCEPIKAFENDTVTSACVADPASCGDGIVQLGEACDGDSDQGKCSADCQTLTGICGDGIVQTGEVCDGNTSEGVCVDCKSIAKPSITLTDVSMTGDFYDGGDINIMSTANVTGSIPSSGDASGCGSIAVVEQTAELLRLKVNICGTGGTATWTIALPLVVGTNVSNIDTTFDAAKWQPTAHLTSTTGKTYDFSGDWGSELSVQLDTDALPGVPDYERTGSLLVNYGSPGETFASLRMDFVLLPPSTP